MENKYYEALRDIVVSDLSHDINFDAQHIRSSIEDQYEIKKRKNPGFFLSADDLKKLQADLEFHFNTAISKEDAALYGKTKSKPTWWTDQKDSIDSYYWSSYKKHVINNEKLPDKVVTRIGERADTVMNYLFNPQDPNLLESKKYGMVIGSVQSGKTANYSALICKAADAGFKIIIIIAGLTSILRQQTQVRIDKSFVGQFDLNFEDPKSPINPEEKGTASDYRGNQDADC